MSPLPRMSLKALSALNVLFFFGTVTAHEVKSLSPEIANEYNLDSNFYAKTTLVQDILIATSDKVPDTTHKEAAYLFDRMMKDLKAPIAQRIRDKKVLCLLVAHNELTSDLPEFKSDKTGKDLDFYNWRQRGFLTKVKDRYVVLFAEEDVMEYEGGMQIESILIHEFGHVIHGAGFDEELTKRWTRTFVNATTMGLWNDGRAAQRFRRITNDQPVNLLTELTKAFPDQPAALLRKCLNGGDILVNGKPTSAEVKVTGKDKVLIVFGGKKRCYAAKNRGEYFAEGVQCWYNTNRTMDHDHNHISTRDQLKVYDPVFAKFLAAILGDNEWIFVSPRDRVGQAHLKNYDPAKSPVAKDPEHLRIAGLEFFDNYWTEYWQRLHKKYPK
ncbi:MAG: hypothetical protein OSB05_07655 [Akkermansiaceae bacterium]|nr:hypothetical protein [Akkermansiaceae bacterium]